MVDSMELPRATDGFATERKAFPAGGETVNLGMCCIIRSWRR